MIKGLNRASCDIGKGKLTLEVRAESDVMKESLRAWHQPDVGDRCQLGGKQKSGGRVWETHFNDLNILSQAS